MFCFVLFSLKWDHRNRVAAGGPCEVSKGSDAGGNGRQLRTAMTMMGLVTQGHPTHSRRREDEVCLQQAGRHSEEGVESLVFSCVIGKCQAVSRE